MGTNTDPYQWVEGRYRLMPGIWEALRDTATPVLGADEVAAACCATSALLQEIAAVTDVTANLSVPTLDERAWRATRAAHAAPARAARGGRGAQRGRHPDGDPRRAADARASTTRPSRSRRSCELRRRRGRDGVGGIALHLRGEVRGDLPRLAARPTGPTSSRATRSSTRAAPTPRGPSGSASRPSCAAAARGFARSRAAGWAGRGPAPARGVGRGAGRATSGPRGRAAGGAAAGARPGATVQEALF